MYSETYNYIINLPNIKYYLLIFSLSILALLLFINWSNGKYFSLFPVYEPVVVNSNLVSKINNSKHNNMHRIYYINLEKSKKRNENFLSKLDLNVWQPLRVDACSPQIMPKIISPSLCSAVINTEYACLASHLKAIHTAYMNGENYAIIAEDDAKIINDIDWKLLINSAPNNWDLLQMHTCCVVFDKISQSYYDSPNILWVKTKNIIPSAAFYIISRKCMFYLLSKYMHNFVKPWDQITYIDLRSSEVNCQADLILFHDIERYICTQSYITTDDSESTIHWLHNFNFNIQGKMNK